MTLAMAKGRTADEAVGILQEAGIRFPELDPASRKLLFADQSGRIELIFVKAADVPTYVEKGAADIGIIGKDVLLEDPKEVYELLDLKIGICKLSVAGWPGFHLRDHKQLTVASKYPAVAKEYFRKKGIHTEIIKLNGSIELAPVIGMADCIVDIVETGKTLRENGLTVIEDITEVSGRLIANKGSYATKTEEIRSLLNQMKEVIEVRT